MWHICDFRYFLPRSNTEYKIFLGLGGGGREFHKGETEIFVFKVAGFRFKIRFLLSSKRDIHPPLWLNGAFQHSEKLEGNREN